MTKSYTRLKLACYTTNLSMSVVACLSPVLFLTFRELYGISYSLLGLLVTVNYVTQLLVDLLLSFRSRWFDIPRTVKSTPMIAASGMLVYAVTPMLLPGNEYWGLLLGTIIFSAAAGLNEVLTSPVIAAIPAKDPDKEMSKLHSVYAWGVVGVILFATAFLAIAGQEMWQLLALLFAIVPTTSVILFLGTEIPLTESGEQTGKIGSMLREKDLWISVGAIFLGGAAENTMTQWSSGYLEMALGIPKVWGDVCGVAMFALMLGLGRTLYAAKGKRIGHVIFLGCVGTVVCYLLAAVVPIPVIGLLACACTGLCTSMLWPGNLIAVTDRYPQGGVFIFALMAAGGDLGGSIAPQLLGIVTDAVIANPSAAAFAQNLAMTPEQLGMKAGMLVGMLFPLVGLAFFWQIRKRYPKVEK